MRKISGFGLAMVLLASCSPSEIIVKDERIACGLADYAKDATIYQNSSAEVHFMFLQCFEQAAQKLEQNLFAKGDEPLAVVVDVDETILDNSRYELERIAEGKTYTPASWTAWVERREAPILPGAKAFLTLAAGNNCEVFYITNRSTPEKAATIDNLKQFGLPNVDEEHVLTKENTSDKTARRQSVQKNYAVMLYVGDQLTDYKQLLKDRTDNYGKSLVDDNYSDLNQYFVLTPNAMYGTWRDVVSGKGTSTEKQGFINAWFKRHKRP